VVEKLILLPALNFGLIPSQDSEQDVMVLLKVTVQVHRGCRERLHVARSRAFLNSKS